MGYTAVVVAVLGTESLVYVVAVLQEATPKKSAHRIVKKREKGVIPGKRGRVSLRQLPIGTGGLVLSLPIKECISSTVFVDCELLTT